MAAKLHQIIALANGQRTRTQDQVTEIYKQVQKPARFEGLLRTYDSQREDEHDLPPEQKNVQALWGSCLADAVKCWSKLINITATQDYANCQALGTIRIDGTTLLADVPVTHLLFLEKHVTDVRTFVRALPVLDPAETWTQDSNRGCYITEPQRKVRTRKVEKVVVLYDATPEHPAQTTMVSEDIVVGEWKTILMSGKIPAETKAKLLDRVEKLVEGVKLAREEANQTQAMNVEIARPLFDYIVDGTLPPSKTK